MLKVILLILISNFLIACGVDNINVSDEKKNDELLCSDWGSITKIDLVTINKLPQDFIVVDIVDNLEVYSTCEEVSSEGGVTAYIDGENTIRINYGGFGRSFSATGYRLLEVSSCDSSSDPVEVATFTDYNLEVTSPPNSCWLTKEGVFQQDNPALADNRLKLEKENKQYIKIK